MWLPAIFLPTSIPESSPQDILFKRGKSGHVLGGCLISARCWVMARAEGPPVFPQSRGSLWWLCWETDHSSAPAVNTRPCDSASSAQLRACNCRYTIIIITTTTIFKKDFYGPDSSVFIIWCTVFSKTIEPRLPERISGIEMQTKWSFL